MPATDPTERLPTERIRRLALSYARRLCPAALGETEREDCAAAAWASGWQAQQRGQPVRTAVWRACLGHVRGVLGRRGERLRCSSLDYLLERLGESDGCALLATDEPGYGEARALAVLSLLTSPLMAEVLRRRVLLGQTEGDVSEAMGVSVNLVRNYSHRGRVRLRALVGEGSPDPIQ